MTVGRILLEEVKKIIMKQMHWEKFSVKIFKFIEILILFHFNAIIFKNIFKSLVAT
jgi:hypothetical protein